MLVISEPEAEGSVYDQAALGAISPIGRRLDGKRVSSGDVLSNRTRTISTDSRRFNANPVNGYTNGQMNGGYERTDTELNMVSLPSNTVDYSRRMDKIDRANAMA